jgi:peptidoglycan biosynthesis protein MviN/MurJ (putative lipid II flippase)
MVAARLGQGRVAALSYADRLFLLPIGFVIAALGPMVLGALVVGRGTKDLTRSANEQLQTLVAAIVPLSLLFVALAPNLVSLVFESGNFNAHSRVITQQALDGFSVGIGAVAVSLVLFRAMQAVGRLRQIVFIAVAAVVFNAVTTVGAGIWLGLYGVTLSTSLVAIATVCLQTEGLVAEFGRPWSHRIYKSAVFPVIGCCAVSLTIVSISHAGVLEERGRVMVSVLATLVFGLLLNLRRRQTQ